MNSWVIWLFFNPFLLKPTAYPPWNWQLNIIPLEKCHQLGWLLCFFFRHLGQPKKKVQRNQPTTNFHRSCQQKSLVVRFKASHEATKGKSWSNSDLKITKLHHTGDPVLSLQLEVSRSTCCFVKGIRPWLDSVQRFGGRQLPRGFSTWNCHCFLVTSLWCWWQAFDGAKTTFFFRKKMVAHIIWRQIWGNPCFARILWPTFIWNGATSSVWKQLLPKDGWGTMRIIKSTKSIRM